MQIDQQVKSQESTLHEHTQQLMSLQQQAAQQKAALEQQAMQLSLDYQQKAAAEEMQKKQFEMQKQQFEMEHKMKAEMAALVHQGGGAAVPAAVPSYTPPPVAQHTVGIPSYTPPVATQMPSYTPPVVYQPGQAFQ